MGGWQVRPKTPKKLCGFFIQGFEMNDLYFVFFWGGGDSGVFWGLYFCKALFQLCIYLGSTSEIVCVVGLRKLTNGVCLFYNLAEDICIFFEGVACLQGVNLVTNLLTTGLHSHDFLYIYLVWPLKRVRVREEDKNWQKSIPSN